MNPGSKPLRIAFLGVDEETPALVDAVIARHVLVGACEIADSGAFATVALPEGLLRARRFDEWEALLDRQLVDAVVVARATNEDLRAEQLRKLVQAEVSVLVAQPVVDSMLIYYELDMIRRDTGAIVVPYLSWRNHPAARALAALAAQKQSSELGKIEQLVMQSSLLAPTRASVLNQFARDVDLIRATLGEMTRLGAMAGAAGDAAYASLGVQMSGPSGVAARWSVDPTPSPNRAVLQLLGTNGKAVLNIPRDDAPWVMHTTSEGRTESHEFEPWQPAAAALDELAQAVHGQPAGPDWVDAARAVELAETIDRSLAKGRTIELYYEDYTEEGTFKGTMTSLGCGLLLLGMFMLVIVALAEQLGLPTIGWPYLLLALMAAFLLLQSLMLVFRGRPEPRSQRSEGDAGEILNSSSDL